jgi:hypothetical protein
MMVSRSVSLLIALVVLCLFAPAAYALGQNDADEAIERFLSSHKSETESAESQGSAVADLNGDGKSEIVLVWTLLGPTYWHNTLTVFTRTTDGYKPAASFQLTGEAKLSSVKGGIIFVDQKVFAKSDPLCCPSVKKQVRYRWLGKKISEVKK